MNYHNKNHIHLSLEFAPNIHLLNLLILKKVSLRFIRKKYFTYLDKYYRKPYLA